ncbi:hypothetical protein LH384_33725, partial [Pseudomonas aeruginosa]|nr:hypothetical protein [Pseudomonas aeruginosa]
EDITQATSLEWNTTALENGDYRLKAAVKDSSDLEGSGTYDIKIANPQGGPIITAKPIRENPLQAAWKFDESGIKIKGMEYLLPGDT